VSAKLARAVALLQQHDHNKPYASVCHQYARAFTELISRQFLGCSEPVLPVLALP